MEIFIDRKGRARCKDLSVIINTFKSFKGRLDKNHFVFRGNNSLLCIRSYTNTFSLQTSKLQNSFILLKQTLNVQAKQVQFLKSVSHLNFVIHTKYTVTAYANLLFRLGRYEDQLKWQSTCTSRNPTFFLVRKNGFWFHRI